MAVPGARRRIGLVGLNESPGRTDDTMSRIAELEMEQLLQRVDAGVREAMASPRRPRGAGRPRAGGRRRVRTYACRVCGARQAEGPRGICPDCATKAQGGPPAITFCEGCGSRVRQGSACQRCGRQGEAFAAGEAELEACMRRVDRAVDRASRSGSGEAMAAVLTPQRAQEQLRAAEQELAVAQREQALATQAMRTARTQAQRAQANTRFRMAGARLRQANARVRDARYFLQQAQAYRRGWQVPPAAGSGSVN